MKSTQNPSNQYSPVTKPCSFCKNEFSPKNRVQKYCSPLCKSRASQQRQGLDAKPILCERCKRPFKRRSAKNTKCVPCREEVLLERDAGEHQNNKAETFTRAYTESEASMISEFLSGERNTTHTYFLLGD